MKVNQSFIVLKNGLPKMIGALKSSSISTTIRLISVGHYLMLTTVFPLMPTSCLYVESTKWSLSSVNLNEPRFSLSNNLLGIVETLAPRSQSVVILLTPILILIVGSNISSCLAGSFLDNFLYSPSSSHTFIAT